MPAESLSLNNISLLENLSDKLLRIDPVYFIEKYLKLDGKPFKINKNGYKPFAEIYRYIGIKALEKDSLPIVIVKGRQVGASTMASALEMFFLGSGLFGTKDKPPIRIAHVFPQLDYAYSYSKTKLSPMITDGPLVEEQKTMKGQKPKSYMQSMLDISSPSNDSLQFKQFIGANHIWIESTGIDGGRLRGKTLDIMFIDEVQDISQVALGNSTKTLAKAQYGALGEGVQVYFGTPKQRGSAFWHMWNQSTQQYYHLGCDKCKKLFPLYTPDSEEWENTWLYAYTVRCAHCGFEQDKQEAVERGKWVGTKDASEAKFIGFHINQLFMPDFTKEKILSEKPGNSTTNTERTYQNEVLGEFFSGSAGVISPDEIRELCGDPERKFRASISSEEDMLTFLGIDLGAKSDLEQLVDDDRRKNVGQSYSTAVVVSVSSPNKLDIQFATKFKRNDLASKKDLIEQLMKRYSINLAVNDIGFSYDISQILQNEYGDKFISSQALARVNEKIKYNGEIFPKVISFERDYYIGELFDQMKKGNIRFPMGSYEQIAWLISHATNFDIKPSLSRTGEASPHFVKNGFTDGFMALLNCYIAYKCYISEYFTIRNPMQMKEIGKPAEKMMILGFMPNFGKGRSNVNKK